MPRPSRASRERIRPLLAAGIAVTVLAQAHATGYLQRLGPAPLRFAQPATKSVAAVLPPLAMENGPEDSSLSETNITALTPSTATETMTAISMAQQPPTLDLRWPGWNLWPDPRATAPLSGAGRADGTLFMAGTDIPGVVTPGMLAQFFWPNAGSTNAVQVVAPVQFVPPTEERTVQSKAEYKVK